MKKYINKMIVYKNNNVGKFYSFFYLLLCIGLFLVSYPLIRYSYQSEQDFVKAENVIESVSYNIIGNKFEVIGDDPHFTFDSKLYNINRIKIIFENKIEQNTDIAVYYSQNKAGFNEKDLVHYQIDEKQDNLLINIKKSKYVRLDIENSFELDKIVLYGQKRNEDNLKFVFAILCLIIVIIIGEKFIQKKETIIEKIENKIKTGLYNIVDGFENKIEIKFFLAALIMGTMVSFLVPPEQVPDEPQHYKMMEEEFGFSGYYDEIYEYYEKIDAVNVVRNYQYKQSKELLSNYKNIKFSDNCKWNSKPSIKCVAHLPAGLIFFLFAFLGAPISVCLHAAEIASVVFFASIGFLAVKIMPIKKGLLVGIMLMPMTLQQCSTINYDAVLLPMCFLLISFLFSLVYRDKDITFKDYLIVIVISFIIVMIKPPYILLVLIGLCIPLNKIRMLHSERIKKIIKHKIIISVIGCVLFCAAIYVFRENLYIKIVSACLYGIKDYIRILAKTISSNIVFYSTSMIGVMGWLDTNFSSFYYITTFVFLLLMSQTYKKKNTNLISKKMRVVLSGTATLLFVMIITIMFSWTFFILEYDSQVGFYEIAKYFKDISVILGVQGRYFIPVIILYLLCISDVFVIEKRIINICQIVYYPCSFVCIIRVLLERFWR